MVSKNAKRRNARVQKVVINPLFEEYAEKINDPYWADIFKDGSLGKFPRGISFNNNKNILTFRRGLKVTSIELSKDHPTAIDQCTDFFRTHSYIKSDLDIENKKAQIVECNSTKQKFDEVTWGSVRRKAVKRMLILNYVNITATSLDLSSEQRDQLTTTIYLGIISGCFCSKNIFVVRGKIEEIVGLMWDPHKEKFYIDRNKVPAAKSVNVRDVITEDDYLRPDYKVVNDFRPVDYQAMWKKVISGKK